MCPIALLIFIHGYTIAPAVLSSNKGTINMLMRVYYLEELTFCLTENVQENCEVCIFYAHIPDLGIQIHGLLSFDQDETAHMDAVSCVYRWDSKCDELMALAESHNTVRNIVLEKDVVEFVRVQMSKHLDAESHACIDPKFRRHLM